MDHEGNESLPVRKTPQSCNENAGKQECMRGSERRMFLYPTEPLRAGRSGVSRVGSFRKERTHVRTVKDLMREACLPSLTTAAAAGAANGPLTE